MTFDKLVSATIYQLMNVECDDVQVREPRERLARIIKELSDFAEAVDENMVGQLWEVYKAHRK